jgi:hypothetical protein
MEAKVVGILMDKTKTKKYAPAITILVMVSLLGIGYFYVNDRMVIIDKWKEPAICWKTVCVGNTTQFCESSRIWNLTNTNDTVSDCQKIKRDCTAIEENPFKCKWLEKDQECECVFYI